MAVRKSSKRVEKVEKVEEKEEPTPAPAPAPPPSGGSMNAIRARAFEDARDFLLKQYGDTGIVPRLNVYLRWLDEKIAPQKPAQPSGNAKAEGADA